MLKRLRNRRKVVITTSLVFSRALMLSVIVFGAYTTRAQDTSEQFWPEINVYVHINEKVRLFFLGTVSKSVEDGEIRDAQAFEDQVGAHVDYIPSKHVILRTGYRFGSSVGETSNPHKEHRILTEQTFRKLLPGDILLSDRNREDFRFVNGDFSFRYRNRLTIEREFHVFKQRSVTPYVSGEVFYDTRYETWNRNRWAVGVQTSLRRNALLKMLLPKRQIVLDLYYMRQIDSRSSEPRVNALGAVLAFYF